MYILAASHSGSTLLAMLLGSHPKVCTVGELKVRALGDVDRYRCSCGRPIKSCPFWIGIGCEMSRRGYEFDLAAARTDVRAMSSAYVRGLLRPLHRGRVMEWIRDQALALSATWRSEARESQARNTALIESVCAVSGKRIIVDSSKIGLRLKYLLRNPALDVRVIRLIRDGRAVALTYLDPSRFADAEEARFRGGGMGAGNAGHRLSIEKAARQWKRSTEEGEAVLAQLDRGKWREVRYEHLCEAPRGVVQALWEFIGVDPEGGELRIRSKAQHVIGNGMRLNLAAEIKADERWKTELKDSDLRVFDALAGRLNRELRYH